MNLELNYEGFESYFNRRREDVGWGVQYVFLFENGFGASVVKSLGSYGSRKDLWELAVIKWNDERTDWEINYDTPITDDVIGFLTDDGVKDLLKKIQEL